MNAMFWGWGKEGGGDFCKTKKSIEIYEV